MKAISLNNSTFTKKKKNYNVLDCVLDISPLYLLHNMIIRNLKLNRYFVNLFFCYAILIGNFSLISS